MWPPKRNLCLTTRKQIKQNLNRPLPQKLLQFSSLFLGHPSSLNGPLGEGGQGEFDQDPLYRFDQFDCTTYVETVMALSQSISFSDFEHKINQIRYATGRPHFFSRNHFISKQWIKSNDKKGFVSDITLKISQEFIGKHLVKAKIDPFNWVQHFNPEIIQIPHLNQQQKQTKLLKLKQMASQYYQTSTASIVDTILPGIPFKEFLYYAEIEKSIPQGAILNFLGPIRIPGTGLIVLHQGLAIWKNKILYLRHATTVGEKKILDIKLSDYISQFSPNSKYQAINILKIN